MKNHVLFTYILCLTFFSACQAQSGSPLSELKNKNTIIDSTYLLKLANREFIPDAGIDQELAKELNSGKESWGILQAWKPIGHPERSHFKNNHIQLLQFLGGTSYLAHFKSGASLEDVKDLIRWAGTLKPIDKLSPALHQKKVEPWAVTAEGNWKIAITFFEGVSEENINTLLKKYQLTVKSNMNNSNWFVEIKPSLIDKLVGESSIKWLMPGPHPTGFFSVDNADR